MNSTLLLVCSFSLAAVVCIAPHVKASRALLYAGFFLLAAFAVKLLG